MACAGGHAEEVATLAEQRVHLARGAQKKDSGPLDEETHLVLVVNVLVEKFAPQLLPARVVRQAAHDVDRLIAAFRFQPLDICPICLHHGQVTHIPRQALRGLPPLEPHRYRS